MKLLALQTLETISGGTSVDNNTNRVTFSEMNMMCDLVVHFDGEKFVVTNKNHKENTSR